MHLNIRISIAIYLVICVLGVALGFWIPSLFAATVPFLVVSVRSPLWSAVYAMLVAFVLFYVLLGVADLSLYRGPIDRVISLREIYSAFTVSFVVLAVMPINMSQSEMEWIPVRAHWLAICFLALPGLTATAIQFVMSPLDFSQTSRFSNNNYVQLIIETLFIPLVLIGLNLQNNNSIGKVPGDRFQKFLVAFIIFGFLLTGYRNYVVGGLLVIGLIVNARKKISRVLPHMGAALTFFVVIGYLRQVFAPKLLALDLVRDEFAVNAALPDWLVQLHMTARETIGITNTIYVRGTRLIAPVFFGDLLTVLPGKHMSGGGSVAHTISAAQSGGLTIGLIGSAITEYSDFSFLFLTIVTLVFCLFMAAPWVRDPARRSIFTFYGFYQFLLVFHTGVVRPGIVITDITLIFVTFLFTSRMTVADDVQSYRR